MYRGIGTRDQDWLSGSMGAVRANSVAMIGVRRYAEANGSLYLDDEAGDVWLLEAHTVDMIGKPDDDGAHSRGVVLEQYDTFELALEGMLRLANNRDTRHLWLFGSRACVRVNACAYLTTAMPGNLDDTNARPGDVIAHCGHSAAIPVRMCRAADGADWAMRLDAAPEAYDPKTSDALLARGLMAWVMASWRERVAWFHQRTQRRRDLESEDEEDYQYALEC